MMRRLAAAVAVVAALAACAPAQTRQSTGEYIDDAWITSRVKGAFEKNLESSAARVQVATYKGQVQLSGFVSDAGDVGKAAAVAGGVKGVKSVRNDIEVR
jgi:hyperosmotically inducible protein